MTTGTSNYCHFPHSIDTQYNLAGLSPAGNRMRSSTWIKYAQMQLNWAVLEELYEQQLTTLVDHLHAASTIREV